MLPEWGVTVPDGHLHIWDRKPAEPDGELTTQTVQTIPVTVLPSEAWNYLNEGGPQSLPQGDASAMVYWVYEAKAFLGEERAAGEASLRRYQELPHVGRSQFQTAPRRIHCRPKLSLPVMLAAPVG